MRKLLVAIPLLLLACFSIASAHLPSTNGASSDTPPILMGYGGVLAVGSLHTATGNPPSKVFSGETASNTEVTFSELKARGYNAARVSIIDPAVSSEASTYNSQAWHKTLQIAQHYGITVIGDDHEYDCPSTTFWQPVFQDTPQSTYPNVLWETKNEPHCSTLASDDQSLINLARGMGDTRWFVLGCNNDCSPSGGGSDLASFPTVTDSSNHVFYDFHEYFFYTSGNAANWTTSAAQAWADAKFAGVKDVQNSLGRPFLGTEFGADTGCGDPTYGCPSDQAIPGSAGWSPESLAYLSRLINNLQGAGIGYTVWNAGDWDDGPVGITGAMDAPSFGPQLPAPTATTPTNPPTTIFPFAGTTLLWAAGSLIIVLSASLSLVVLRRRRTRANSARTNANSP